MALRTPALFMGNPAINHTAQSMRLAKAGLLRPETGQAAATRPLTAVSGVLAGPDGTMGEVTLLSNTQFTVNPARWFIQSSDTPLGGAYEVTNDAVETVAITAQDATQFRKAYFGVWVIDSFVAGSGDDQPHWGLVNGPLAASNPQLPAAGTLPENFLALGEFLIPPTGQAVTYTAYLLRTGLRGGILPVPATDTRSGSHAGAARWHPTNGLEIWDAANTRWGSPLPLGQWVTPVASATSYSYTLPGSATDLPGYAVVNVGAPFIPAGRQVEVQFRAPQVQIPYAGGSANLVILVNGVVVDGAFISSIAPPGGGFGFSAQPVLLSGVYRPAAAGTYGINVQGWGGGNAFVTAGASMGPYIRYRII